MFDFDLAVVPSQMPAAQVDEGPITITGTVDGVPPCSFEATESEYLCVSGAGATASSDAVTQLDSSTAEVSIVGAAFAADHVGQFLRLSGHATSAANGLFPILGANAGSAIIGKPGAGAGAPDDWGAIGDYVIVAGAGPTPASVNFIDNTSVVMVSKPASAEIDAFNQTVVSAGAGYTLAAGSAKPSAMNVDGNAVVFDCVGSGGTCGTGLVTAVSGFTTNASVATLPPFAMPQGTRIKAFTCAFFGTTAIIPGNAMDEILADGTTRIETRVFRFNLTQFGNAEGANGVSLVVGTGHLGWTTR